MATLQSLALSGIRSFGPDKEHIQKINFQIPVTLFLGQNGCGKTTILESIKFALSGEVPGGSTSGQGFINDPSLTERSETKAQVKLKIVDSNGQEITIAKILKLTKTKTGCKFQRVDSSIKRKRPGEEAVSFSGRCADIDAACCEALKVSPIILNDVLLCHQDNSSWPLDEGKKLKDKFDDIFETTKYNKCLDVIRKIMKGKQAQIKFLKLELDTKIQKKDFVERERSKLEDFKSRLEELEDNIKTKQEKIVPVKAKFAEVCKKEEKFGLLKQDLAKKEQAKKGVIETQNTLKKNITVSFEGSDEELRKKIKTFETSKKSDENTLVDLERKKVVLESKEKTLNGDIQKCQIKFGQLNEEKNQFECRKAERKNLLEKGKIQFNIVGNSSDISTNEGAKSMLNGLVAAVEASEDFFNELKETKTQEEEVLQATIEEIREKHISTKQNIESQKKTLTEHREKIRDLGGRLGDLSCSENTIKRNNEKMERIQAMLQTAKADMKEVEFNTKMNEYKTGIENMEKKREELENEYRQVQKNNVTFERLNNEKENVTKKKNEINKLKNKHASNFEYLFQSSVPGNNLQRHVKEIQNKSDGAVRSLQKKIDDKRREITTLEGTKTHQEEQIKRFQEDIKAKKNKVNNLCKGKQFDDYIKEVYNEKEKLQSDKAICTSGKAMFERFIKNFEDKSCCPICRSNFTGKQNAIKEIVNSLKTELNNIPGKLVQVEQKLKANEDLYIKLQQLQPVRDEIEVIYNCNIPLLQEKLTETTTQLDLLKTELSSVTDEIKIPQKKLEVSESLISDAAIIDLHEIDIKKSERNIEDLQQQVSDVSTKSAFELESELDNLKIDLIEMRRKCDTDKARFDKNKKVYQDLRDQHSECMEYKLKLEGDVQSKPELEKQLKEYSEKETALKSEIQELEIKCNSLKQNLDVALKNKSDLCAANKRLINQEQEKINKNKSLIKEIDRVQRIIDDYLNKPNKLDKLNEELKGLESKASDLEACKNKIISDISNKREELSNHESTFRSLLNNVALREKQEEENALTLEIEQLKNKIGNDDIMSVLHEKQQLQRNYESLNNEVYKMEGEKAQLNNTIVEKTEELNQPSNKDAYKDYKNKFYEMKVTKSLIVDLETYSTVMENSILEHHKGKMQQINKTIRQLWRNIYRGNDIDYIEIKPEENTTKGSRRTYNYKVVQIKRGVEIEMRGRCSAGQKVLACLVIRMALAEIFSTSCGILALDEPTTNLDQENVKSLTDALASIITERQTQKNFQLLIITHDEDFLDMLLRLQCVNSYFKVGRNEKGFSVVSSVAI